MKKTVISLSALVTLAIFGCSSTDDCTKTITIPGITIITPTGSVYYPEYQQVVSCDYVETPLQEQAPLQNFTYEVLDFTFTPDTGNNTKRLKFDIKLNNLNNFPVKGFAYITTNADGLVSSSAFINDSASSICDEIAANSSCIFSYDRESPLELELGFIESIELVDVKYYLTE